MVIKSLIIVLCLSCSTWLNAGETSRFANPYNRCSGTHIQRFKICGERCSGTNYISHLFMRNFPALNGVGLHDYGHKHFMWWHGKPAEEKILKSIFTDKRAVTFEGSDDCLFIVAVRDPYDWVRSFYLLPHHVDPVLASSGFSYFISVIWKLKGPYNAIDGTNPLTGKPFKNVCQLRSAKIKNYLKLKDLVKNLIVVRYEDARDYPEEFVDFIYNTYQLNKSPTFIPIEKYKGDGKTYVRKKYFSFLRSELKYFNKNIDWDVEKLVNYYKQKVVE